MILTKRIRLLPTLEQEEKMIKSANVARWAYNWALSRQQENYKSGGKFISNYDLRKEITQLKKNDEYKWLNEVSAQIPAQAVREACNAYIMFFNGVSDFPKFKSKNKAPLSFHNRSDVLKPKDKTIGLERIGRIKTSEPLASVDKYYDARVKHDGKHWYLTAGIKQEIKQIEITDNVIGIDLGIKDLAVTSDGVVYKNINKTSTIKKEEKKLKRLQRQVSRIYRNTEKDKPKSKNLLKLERKIRLKYRRLQNIRNNHIHQITTEIVKTKPSKVVMEDLNVRGMMKNKHLSKAVGEQKFHFFKHCMEYKCELHGIEFVLADTWFPSSKTCSNCGVVKEDLKLSDRTFKCDDCGFVCGRDLNASYNLRDYQK